MICPVCNCEVENNTRFCPSCGAQLEFPNTSATAPQNGASSNQYAGQQNPYSAQNPNGGPDPSFDQNPNYGQSTDPNTGYSQGYANGGPNPGYGQPGPGYHFCKHCGQPLSPGLPSCANCGAPVGAGNYYCPNCGSPANNGGAVCTNCGSILNPAATNPLNPPKSKLVAGLLGIFLGCFGVHNFYLGFTEKAVIQLILTIVGIPLCCIVIGGFMILGAAIWGLVEGIMILTGSIPADAKGVPLTD